MSDVQDALDEALETYDGPSDYGSWGKPQRQTVGQKARGRFLLRLQRFLDGVPDDMSIDDLRDEVRRLS